MIENVVREYLSEKVNATVKLEEERDEPKRLVLVEKTGGSRAEHVNRATIAIKSHAESLFEAARLNECVKDAMGGFVELDEICRCDLNTDYNFTDTSKKRYRYQAVFDVVYY